MRRRPQNGQCQICGREGRLTFEHVPPAAAYNDHRILQSDVMKLFAADDKFEEFEKGPKKIKQGGFGRHTLCEPCNSNTGGWYGRDYVRLVQSIYPECRRLPSGSTVDLAVRTYPLRIIKQVLAMFCSVNSPGFCLKRPDVARYLLNREERNFPHGIELWTSLYDFNTSIATRQSGISSRLDLGSGKGPIVFSEVAHPPFNFVMTIDGSMRPDRRLRRINHLNGYNYDEVGELRLRLSTLGVTTAFPADYRSKTEVRRDVAINRANI